MWSGLRRSNSSTEIPARAAIDPAPSPDCTTIDEPSAAAVALDGVVSADSVASSFSTCLEELDALVEDDFSFEDFSVVDFSLSSSLFEFFSLDEDLTTLLVDDE